MTAVTEAEENAWRDAVALAEAAYRGDEEAIGVLLGATDLRETARALASICSMALWQWGLGFRTAKPEKFLPGLRAALEEEIRGEALAGYMEQHAAGEEEAAAATRGGRACRG